MFFIEDYFPANIIYRHWFERRRIFIESLGQMRYCDWVIHKKLGSFKHYDKPYIIMGRGSGKSMFYHIPTDEDGDS